LAVILLMLARIAENIYWLGRYIERVDDTLRLLEVQEETASEADARPWSDVFQVSGVDHQGKRRGDVIEVLVRGDGSHSLRTCVRMARENARVVRDRLTLEVWTAINGFYLGLERRAPRADLGTPDILYDWIRERCDLIWGTIDNTLVRDEGWAWLSVGRQIERTNMAARTLLVMMGGLIEPDERTMHNWLTLLRFVSGSHAFRRVSSGTPRATDIIAFVMRSPVFPRSLAYSVKEAHAALKAAGHQETRAARRLMRLHAELDFLNPSQVTARPDTLLKQLLRGLDAVHSDLQEEIFGLEPVLMSREYNSAL